MNGIPGTKLPLILIAGLLLSCLSEPAPEIRRGIDACSLCNMSIDRLDQACGFYFEGGFLPFDAPTCLLKRYTMERHREAEVVGMVFFGDRESGRLVPADSVAFLLTEHTPTVMHSGVLTFADNKKALEIKQHDEEVVTDWRGFRRLKGTPDRTVRISISDSGVVPDVIALAKGELIEFTTVGVELSEEIVCNVQGYDDAGRFRVTADGSPGSYRLLADKPGAGFPIVRIDNGKTMGMIKVSGAHTADEEEM